MSLKNQITEEATTDRQDINSRIFAQLKTFTFYIFYEETTNTKNFKTNPSLQKLWFKMKDDKLNSSSELKSSPSSKQIQMFFYSIDNESQTYNGLIDLKMQSTESKVKVIAYTSESKLIELITKADGLDVDIYNIPIIISSNGIQSDLSLFLGWNLQYTDQFIDKPTLELESLAKKWISSPQIKVDVWSVEIKVNSHGLIEKLIDQEFQKSENNTNFIREHFISHFSIGYHPKLSAMYEEKRSSKSSSFINKCIYQKSKISNFCCLGGSTNTMKASTGVVSINFIDQKKQELEIFKHFREYEGSDQSEVEGSRAIKSDKGILSLVLTSIDRFHGQKIDEKYNCKAHDGKLQLLVFESSSKCRKVISMGGEIKLSLDQNDEQPIMIQIGQNIYRLTSCQEVRVKHANKIKNADSSIFIYFSCTYSLTKSMSSSAALFIESEESQ